MDYKTITVVISKSIHEELQKRKEATGISIQFQINKILQKSLEADKCRLQK